MMHDVAMGMVIRVWFPQLFNYPARAEFEAPAAARVHRVLKIRLGDVKEVTRWLNGEGG